MLTAAEVRLARAGEDGSHRLQVWAPAEDRLRQEFLTRRGYCRGQWPEYQWRRDLDGAVTKVPVPTGFTIRSLDDGLELLERCYSSGLGIHQRDIKVAVENRDDHTWYRNIQTAPL